MILPVASREEATEENIKNYYIMCRVKALGFMTIYRPIPGPIASFLADKSQELG